MTKRRSSYKNSEANKHSRYWFQMLEIKMKKKSVAELNLSEDACNGIKRAYLHISFHPSSAAITQNWELSFLWDHPNRNSNHKIKTMSRKIEWKGKRKHMQKRERKARK